MRLRMRGGGAPPGWFPVGAPPTPQSGSQGSAGPAAITHQPVRSPAPGPAPARGQRAAMSAAPGPRHTLARSRRSAPDDKPLRTTADRSGTCPGDGSAPPRAGLPRQRVRGRAGDLASRTAGRLASGGGEPIRRIDSAQGRNPTTYAHPSRATARARPCRAPALPATVRPGRCARGHRVAQRPPCAATPPVPGTGPVIATATCAPRPGSPEQPKGRPRPRPLGAKGAPSPGRPVRVRLRGPP
jgi:hypothetical protein